VIDGLDNATSYEYDRANRRTSETNAEEGTTTYGSGLGDARVFGRAAAVTWEW